MGNLLQVTGCRERFKGTAEGKRDKVKKLRAQSEPILIILCVLCVFAVKNQLRCEICDMR